MRILGAKGIRNNYIKLFIVGLIGSGLFPFFCWFFGMTIYSFEIICVFLVGGTTSIISLFKEEKNPSLGMGLLIGGFLEAMMVLAGLEIVVLCRWHIYSLSGILLVISGIILKLLMTASPRRKTFEYPKRKP